MTVPMPQRTDFADALDFVLGWEGGLYLGKEKRDPNPTKFGVTLKLLKGLGSAGDMDRDGDVDLQDIVHMTRDQAAAIYERIYWNGSNADDVDLLCPKLATVLFDSSVQHGIGRASELLQRTIRVTPDGKIGPQTLAMLRVRLQQPGPDSVIQSYLERRRAYYAAILLARPELRPNANGWRNRVNALCFHVGVPPVWEM